MVADPATLLAAIDEFEATLRESALLAKSDFGSRRIEAVALRRKIAEHRNSVFALIVTTRIDSELQSTFRSRFSKLCAIIALHHASWPVISIDLESPEYLTSITSVRAEYTMFFQWARSALEMR